MTSVHRGGEGVGQFLTKGKEGVQNPRNLEDVICTCPLSWYWKVTWSVAPVILLTIFALSVYAWKTPDAADSEFYPTWAHSVGWFLMLFVTMQIPAVAVIMVILYAVRGKARAVVSRDSHRQSEPQRC